MEDLGIVPFHDLHFEEHPAYQRQFPILCLRLHGFMKSRAEYHRGGPSLLEIGLEITGVAGMLGEEREEGREREREE
jgi:hypothetical protein